MAAAEGEEVSWPPADPRGAGRTEAVHERSDEDLVAGMGAGDPVSAAAFVRRHERRVLGITFAVLGERHAAEDAAQEAFLRAFRHARRFDPARAPARSWLAVIARNAAIDAGRARRSVPLAPDDLAFSNLASNAPDAEGEAIRAETMRRLAGALGDIPSEQRRALLRSAYLGESADTIAAAEGIPLGTAKSRIRIAMRKARAALALEEERP